MKAVRFKAEQLQSFNILPELLTPFVLTEEHQRAIAGETFGHTSLERYPIIRTGDSWILVMPAAITLAIRRYVVEQMDTHRYLGAFDDMLHQQQKHLFLNDVAGGMKIRPLTLRLPVKPPALQFVQDVVGTFDEGKFVHLVFLRGNIKGIITDGVNYMDRFRADLAAALGAYLRDCAHHLSQQVGFGGGLTLMTMGGLGRGAVIDLPVMSNSWGCFFAPLSDLLLLSQTAELSAPRLWRLWQHLQLADQHHLEIANPSGLLNLLAFWKESGFRLFIRDMPLNHPRKLASISCEFGGRLRVPLKQKVDRHACPEHTGAGWIRVCRKEVQPLFGADKNSSIYADFDSARHGILRALVKTQKRNWWVTTSELPRVSSHRGLVYQLWDCVLNWLERLAPAIERQLPSFTFESIMLSLDFPKLTQWTVGGRQLPSPTHENAFIEVDGTTASIILQIPEGFLSAFNVPTNDAEMELATLIIDGVCRLVGTTFDEKQRLAILNEVFPNSDARYFHFVVTRDLRQMLASHRPDPEFITDEDASLVQLGLVDEVGRPSNKDRIEGRDACRGFLEKAVTYVWERLESRLKAFNRNSVVIACFRAIDELGLDRKHWNLTARAVLAVQQDKKDALRVACERQMSRDAATLANRLIIETAMYSCPVLGGRNLTQADQGLIQAETRLLVALANHRDALSSGFMKPDVLVFPNGEIQVDEGFYASVMGGYSETRANEMFEAAAEHYDSHFEPEQEDKRGNKRHEDMIRGLQAPFRAEFGISLDQLFEILNHLRRMALKNNASLLEFPEEVFDAFLTRTCGLSVLECRSFLTNFSLPPRGGWNLDLPQGCKESDVWPWKFRRKLSLLLRPLVLVSGPPAKSWLVSPTFLEESIAYLLHCVTEGLLPTEFFHSDEMRTHCGEIVNREGNLFTDEVAGVFAKAGFHTKTCVLMTALGTSKNDGPKGDVDVLAWRSASEPVFVVECKRLRRAATVREVIERLEEFRGGKGDSLEKHLKRFNWLKTNPGKIAALTGIGVNKLVLESLLVTSETVPMQFFEGLSISKDRVLPVFNLNSFLLQL